jgi:hypothetical protein
MKLVTGACALILSAGAATAQITNGGFETGDLTGWTISATNPMPSASNGQANSGSFSGLLGTPGGFGTEPLGDSSIYQGFTVPGGTSSLNFSYWTSTTDSIIFDWQDAYLQDAGGTTLATIFHECTNHGWTPVNFDLTPYAGQSVRIAYLVHQDGFGDLTAMYVDDVSVVPAPGSVALLGLGGLLAGRRRRR